MAQIASDREYTKAGKRMLDEIESPLLREELLAAQRDNDGLAEVVVSIGMHEEDGEYRPHVEHVEYGDHVEYEVSKEHGQREEDLR